MGADSIDDLSWLDEAVRARALETLRALFAQSRICMMTFDARGAVIGVNPHTGSFGGRSQATYQGLSLLEHPILRRLGWAEPIKRVLSGEAVELSDTRWVTLFSGEERYVDVTAAPVVVDGDVVGGVACLIDTTAKHRAEEAKETQRHQLRELELFLARDVGRPLSVLRAWSKQATPTLEETAQAMVAVGDLVSLVEDLQEFLQLGSYQPKLGRVPLAEVMRAAGIPPLGTPGPPSLGAIADPRLLRRALQNVLRCAARIGGGGWSVAARDGRVHLEIGIDGSHRLLQELLTANSLAMMEASGADSSLVAARWMIELMGGALTVHESAPILRIDLPAAPVER